VPDHLTRFIRLGDVAVAGGCGANRRQPRGAGRLSAADTRQPRGEAAGGDGKAA
jgi:hypothetical protein